MLIRAKKSFAGALTMHIGQIVDCNSSEIVDDLLRADYVELLEQETQPEEAVKANGSKSTKRRKTS